MHEAHLRRNARVIDELDIALGFASLASDMLFTRPIMTNTYVSLWRDLSILLNLSPSVALFTLSMVVTPPSKSACYLPGGFSRLTQCPFVRTHSYTSSPALIWLESLRSSGKLLLLPSSRNRVHLYPQTMPKLALWIVYFRELAQKMTYFAIGALLWSRC
jgi:hypothetical protein